MKLQLTHALALVVAVGLATAEDYSKNHGTQRGSGLYDIDPKVMNDPLYKTFPNAESPAVRNARFLADAVRLLFSIKGFDVFKDGRRVGILPAYYLGFPKSGSTFSYYWLRRRLPCMIANARGAPVAKELAVVKKMAQELLCSVEFGVLKSCDAKQLERQVTSVLAPFSDGADEIMGKSNTTCRDAFFFDGWPDTIFRVTQRVMGKNGKGVTIPFDNAVFIAALTPSARFIAVARKNDVKSLHSHYFFFLRKRPDQDTPSNYESALITVEKGLKTIVTKQRKCQSLLNMKNLPRMASYASSCSLQRIRILFGAHAVFITDSESLESCADNILDWFSDATQVRKSCPNAAAIPARNNEHSHAGDGWNLKFPFTPKMLELEQSIIALFDQASYPLIPMNPTKFSGEGRNETGQA